MDPADSAREDSSGTAWSDADGTALESATASGRFALGMSHGASGVCVVTVGGDLDALTAPAFMDCVRGQVTAGATSLVVDLEKVEFLGSAGLAALVESSRMLADSVPGAKLRLSGAEHRSVRRPLELVGLLSEFDVHPTVADALRAIEAAGSG